MATKIPNTTPTATSTTPKLIDIGINLTHRQFQHDREDVIQRAHQEANVCVMVLTGTSVRSSVEAQKYCAKTASPNVHLFSTAGVHPHDAKSCDETTLNSLRRLAKKEQVVAIGECGLDYNRNFSEPAVQRKWFQHQLELASELQMPVFLHERDAFEDFFGMIQRFSDKLPAMVVHCFTGNREALEAYLSLPNVYIGITGWICDDKRGKHLRDIVGLIPDDRLMIETDAPFLLPRDLPLERRGRSKKNRRNEPAYLDHVCDAVASCRQQTSEYVAHITTANAVRFFGLPPFILADDQQDS